MIRTSIIPQSTDILVTIPQKYVGRKVEVFVYSDDEITQNDVPKKLSMADFWAKLSDESAQKIHANINVLRSEWEKDI